MDEHVEYYGEYHIDNTYVYCLGFSETVKERHETRRRCSRDPQPDLGKSRLRFQKHRNVGLQNHHSRVP
jgi:hypothetical protein